MHPVLSTDGPHFAGSTVLYQFTSARKIGLSAFVAFAQARLSQFSVRCPVAIYALFYAERK